MAKSTTGKWVSRVGSSGGGKAYRRSRPSNYYGAIAVIVILGLVSVVYARYLYQNPTKAKTVAPAVGTKWFVGLASEVCGTVQPYFLADPDYAGGYKLEPDNVIYIDPTLKAEAGKNATFALFQDEYQYGLVVTPTELGLPSTTGKDTPSVIYSNGETCPATSKYKGQKGYEEIAYWKNLAQLTPTITTNPATIKFTPSMRITVAFEPKGVVPTAPSATTMQYVIAYETTPPTTTTTSATSATTTTTAPTTTTTTTSSSSTTTSTTTNSSAVTTTTKG